MLTEKISIYDLPQDVHTNIIFFLGPQASYPRTSRFFRIFFRNAMIEFGRDLATFARKDFRIEQIVPSIYSFISEDLALAIQQQTLKKVKQVWNQLFSIQKNEFGTLTPAQISLSPHLLQKLLQFDLDNLAHIYSQCDDIDPSAVKDCPLKEIFKIKFFSISFGITLLPESIGRLIELRKMDLSLTQLEQIPESIGDLVLLKKLTISHSKLKILPPSLGKLHNLTKLLLSYNELEAIPDSIGSLSSLKELDLSQNRLKIIPATLGNIRSLKILGLSSNQIEWLPDCFEKFENLTHLFLSLNKLQMLPSSFGKLVRLRCLFLDHNRLNIFPDTLEHLGSLLDLNLSDNKLQALPKFVQKIQSLKHLTLSENSLYSLPIWLCELPNLCYLNLRNNCFVSTRDFDELLKALRKKGCDILF